MKAILVIDDMPMRCCECKYYRFADKYDCHRTICVINGERCENGIDYKPSACPLRPLPEKQKLTVTGKNQIEKKRIIKSKSLEQIKKGFINNSEVAFYCGYNACLDEILGEEND